MTSSNPPGREEQNSSDLSSPAAAGPSGCAATAPSCQSEKQIKHMVDRFLGWRLPDNFRPDGGVHFDPDGAKKLNPRNLRYTPYGTNLLDSTQAEAMVRHMLEGLPE